MCKHNAIPSDPLIHGKPEKERKLEEAFFFYLVGFLFVGLLTLGVRGNRSVWLLADSERPQKNKKRSCVYMCVFACESLDVIHNSHNRYLISNNESKEKFQR